MDGSDPIENYFSIRRELKKYNESLIQRPEILVTTKSELPEAVEIHRELEKAADKEVQLISAVTGTGLPELIRKISQLLKAAANDDQQATA